MTTKTKAKPVPLELDDVRFIATEGSILVHETRVVCITIGVVLKSQGQWSNNWRAAAGRSKRLREITVRALRPVAVQDVTHYLGGKYPTRIGFTRLAPRLLDSDNLASVFKPIRDQVCAWLVGKNEANARANDGMRSGYTFTYHQQQQRAYGARVELDIAP